MFGLLQLFEATGISSKCRFLAAGFTVEQLKQGAEWAVSQRNEGRPVYVHCAYGHGRSCTMLSACLTEAKIFPNFVAAFRHISSLRPRV